MVGQVSMEFPPDRVKLIRALKKMSQPEFSDRYGISVTTISRLENGEVTPTLAVVGRLMEAAQEVGA